MTKPHVMLDIETWGKGSYARTVSIGAARFDPMGEGVIDCFYAAIDPRSADGTKLEIDTDTVLWWMSADNASALAKWLAEDKVDIYTAITGFMDWLGTDIGGVWGNGATFDNVIITNTADKLGLTRPWSHKLDRCFRTLRSFAPDIKAEQEGLSHHALDDAIWQAKTAQMIIKHLGIAV